MAGGKKAALVHQSTSSADLRFLFFTGRREPRADGPRSVALTHLASRKEPVVGHQLHPQHCLLDCIGA